MAERELKDVVQRVTDESTALTRAQFGAFFYNVLDARGESLHALHDRRRSAVRVRALPDAAQHRGLRADVPRRGRRPQRRHHRRPALRPQRALLRHAGGPPAGALLPRRARQGARRRGARRPVLRPRAHRACSTRTRSAWSRRSPRSPRWRSRTPGCTTPRGASSTPAAAPTASATASPACCRRACCRPRLPEIAGPRARRALRAGRGHGRRRLLRRVRRRATASSAPRSRDVQGKDARAAAMTGVVRHTLRAGRHPVRASRAPRSRFVNRVVQEEQEPRTRASAASRSRCSHRDARRRRVARRQRRAPARARRARRAARSRSATRPGTLIGITDTLELGDAHATLGPGDALVLYTDGLIEARSPDGAMLGEERVQRAARRARRARPPRSSRPGWTALAESYSGRGGATTSRC